MLGNPDHHSSAPAAGDRAPKEDKSYFAPPPAISLPKGGGAIKGMGEKFAANPVTGTGSMSVPIATTPGRSGFAPQLSLSYDSGSGNGMFGMGWNLSLPAVTRKTDKGLPRYWDGEESDVFILSGAEDLVPLLNPDGSRFQDKATAPGFIIYRYRPRIEGLFARIERWTKLDSGEIHWRSISKDNITTLYGKTENSRIADPDNLTNVFSYLICESYDDKGNAIYYRYKSEDEKNSNGIDLAQAHEGNRTPKSRSSNRYLKHIYYGNQNPRRANEDLSARTDWLFEVVFDYGEHDRDNPQPTESKLWTTDTLRLDAFSSYRSGFEVRTYRLCQRVLMFHHFPNEEGVGKDCLVRSTDFSYSNDKKLIYSLIKSVTQTGSKRQNGSGYIKKSLPKLEFTYSEPIIDERVWDIDRDSLENLPQGLDGTRYQWVDLNGEGLSGILTEQGNGWFYKRNLSPINPTNEEVRRVEAKFAAVAVVETKPASGLANGAQFLDLAGDGQPDVAILRGATPGFYERTQDEGWESFVAFKSLPNLDWDDPNLKFIDLDGDGHSDILIMEGDCFKWYPSLAEDGFGAAERVSQPWDEDKGARVVFADGTQSIYLADMSGDGLTDIVRIRNGDVCYWPNLGYGRFGAKVTMDDSPWFDAGDIFNQKRIVLADIDGSGTTDILYLSAEGVQVYFNQSGNSWSKKWVLKSFPTIDSAVSVTTLDLLGNGTACLVWSSPLPGSAPHVMRYIDLMGGYKPHLLVKTVNNMGAETVVQYAPSTKFYLADERKGQPWITKLPFPVHVVERVETDDRISGNRFVSRYAYHHGYFDGVEREFRGFGMVEQWDTEEIGTVKPGDIASDSTNLDAASFVPPVLTKTWFHPGAYFDREKISRLFEHEYYREPEDRVPADASEAQRQIVEAKFAASLLPDPILPLGLTAPEEREAVRSLKGHILRLEIYALDGSDKQPHPYSVSERNYEIRLEQAVQTNRHAVFFAHDRETIDYHYERNPVDPRVTHAMTLEVDEFGNGLKSVAIAYPRRQPAFPEQAKTFITYTENQVTNKPNDKLGDPDWYRIGVPIETRTYEITGLEITSLPSFVPYSLDSIRNKLQEIASRLQEPNPIPKPEIAYEEFPDGSLQRRLIEQVRTLYRPDAQANNLDPTPLALGVVESLALPYESFKLAFTPGLLAQVYSSKITTAELNLLLRDEGKYVQQNFGEGVVGWWIPSGRQAFDPNQFYLAIASKDPFGQTYKTTYDTYALLSIKTEDPIGNEIKVKHDYRVMQPWEITDPNGNRSQAAFDALGMVVGTAVMGKATGSTEGDSLTTFNTDLTSAEITAFFDADDPRSLATQHLGTATTRIIYDLDRTPVCAAAIARKQHVSDLADRPLTLNDVQVSFVYSDGFGREAQTKAQAEPGPLDLDVPSSPMLNPRWVGTGTKVYNNKGKPVRQYEPFFSPDRKFGIEQHGVSSMLFYDPVERVVATLHPNHTWEKVIFDPWQQQTYDVNDTVTFDPKTDADVGGFLGRLPEVDYLPTWYQQRLNGVLGTQEKNAAEKAAKHADTPTVAHFDTLGRPFLTIADNGKDANNNDQKYSTRVELDIEGNQRVVTDARGNRVMVQDFDLLSHVIHSQSGDAGERWMLNNVAGHPMRSWDSRGHQICHQYDALQRPTHLFVQPAGAAKFLAERVVYGEAVGNATDLNLRGKALMQFDGAGVVTHLGRNPQTNQDEAYDFKGNLRRSTRRLVRWTMENKQRVDWLGIEPQLQTTPPAPLNLATLETALIRLLEADVFTTSTAFDALNRPTQLTTPDRSVYQPIYNEANLLEQVKVNLRGSTTETLFVKDIDYNAKGQRVLIEYSVKKSDGTLNVVATEYHYDPDTFRLTNLTTIRQTDKAVLQNLSYTYDPVGNITEIRDKAQQTIFFQNDVVSPISQYEYDPLYRLIRAEGREHVGQNPNAQPDHTEIPRMELPHVNNAQAMRRYRESYEYDPVGNILKMIHRAMNNNQPNEPPVWTRRYSYQPDNNRLQATSLLGDGSGIFSGKYAYDEHGNMTQMPHLPLMQWDFKDQLQASSQQIRNDGGKPEITYFVYDASGQRVRKVTERQAEPGQTPKRMKERIYLGGFELYREYNGDGNKVTLERETLHIMDDQKRIVLVETKTVEVKDSSGGRIATPQPITLYQLSNHLGSASLELDDGGNVVSYEEYHPYGTTAYQGGRSVVEVSLKRYRYTGKERDEESGLSYHGARYYAPWLGRWTSCDPAGMVDGLNLYPYARANPLRFWDPTGKESAAPLLGNVSKKKVLDQFVYSAQLYRDEPRAWNEEKLGTIQSLTQILAKSAHIPGTPNNLGVLAVEETDEFSGSTKAKFDSVNWKLQFNKNEPKPDIGAIVHEIRHAEQRFLAARYLATQKNWRANKVAASLKIPESVARQAALHLFGSKSSKEYYFAKSFYHEFTNTKSNTAVNRDQIISQKFDTEYKKEYNRFRDAVGRLAPRETVLSYASLIGQKVERMEANLAYKNTLRETDARSVQYKALILFGLSPDEAKTEVGHYNPTELWKWLLSPSSGIGVR